MNIIFLDIDGVLNSLNFFIERYPKVIELNKNYIYDEKFKLKRRMLDIDINKLKILKEIIDESNAQVVITSSWKHLEVFPLVKEQLINLGIPIIGITEGNSENRGVGIRKYIQEFNIENYIILDDDIFDDYDEDLLRHLVKTSFKNDGLTNEHKEIAVKMLIKK